MQGMDERSYFTYIVASRSLTLYVGMTRDLNKRVFEHKRKLHEGFSATYNCDRLVWFEEHGEVGDAIAREKQLKGWRRDKKIALIKQKAIRRGLTWLKSGIPASSWTGRCVEFVLDEAAHNAGPSAPLTPIALTRDRGPKRAPLRMTRL